ncbi:hypothetical protein KAI92_04380 [Candidatus Parcubacteria bacterium]|nr:hypothetical protein [Candidatus Parcubacteria bacterium]
MFIFLINISNTQAIQISSDRISLSWPDTPIDHEIKFRLEKDIPAGGKIIVIPEAGFFTPSGFGDLSVDIASSDNLNGSYSDRFLASTSGAVFDGVSALASTTNSRIEITLNSTLGITAGKFIQIELGQNASFQGTSSLQIVNPLSVKSYGIEIETYDNSSAFLEKSQVMVAILRPVTMSNYITKKRLKNSPSGWLTYGTTQTIMSLITNYPAICRYSTASGTAYSAMVNEFFYIDGESNIYHTAIVDGLVIGTKYNYYVRCKGLDGVEDEITRCHYDISTTTMIEVFDGSSTTTEVSSTIIHIEEDCVDYEIEFSISSVEGGTGDTDDGDGGEDTGDDGDDTGDTGDTGSGGGGGSGGGSGGGIGITTGDETGRGVYLPYPPPLGVPGVILEGWGYPGMDVVILKDGVEIGKAATNFQAKFGAFLEDLNQGTYTFGLRSSDTQNRESLLFTTTFFVEKGTQSTVSDIILAPTIATNKTTVIAGEKLELFGETVPNSKVEVWFYKNDQEGIREEDVIKTEGISTNMGKWNFLIDTEGIEKGSYMLKARVKIEGVNYSDFGKIINVSIGVVQGDNGICANADLNQDGKVNITDFSILLYYWGTDDACADQNHNGEVELTDFSIMMYYWTG